MGHPKPALLRSWIREASRGRGAGSGGLEQQVWAGKSAHCAWSLSGCPGEVRSGITVLFYYIRIVTLLPGTLGGASAATAEKPGD